MRQMLRVLGIGFWSLLSLDIVVAILDWLGRLDWLRTFMQGHPRVAAFVHTPFVYLALLILGFLFPKAERKVKLPRIAGRYTNSRIVPNLSTTPMVAVFETQQKAPGWDERKLDWHWFVEVQFANDSDTPTTMEDIEVRVKAGRKIATARYIEDISNCKIKWKGDHDADGWPRYAELPSLMKDIHRIELTRGIGHRGWLCFEVAQVSQRDINNKPSIDIWLVDALQGRHKIQHQRESEHKWDTDFEIFKD